MPLSEATIPEGTLAFLDSLSNRLVGGGDDHLVLNRVDTISTDSWNNRHDFGRKDTNGFYVCDVDSLFVIYSDTKDNDLINKVHQFALSAIEPLKDMMGQYIYPYMVNGRKLPLYLCANEDMYQMACRNLAEDEDDYSKTWGLCVQSYSGFDVLTLGIALNYGSMKRLSTEPELNLKATVWHEMNHYVYFQSIDLSSEITMHTWVYEGMAEYFASNVKKQTTALTEDEKGAVYTNTLTTSFTPFSFNYSGGELFYDFLEEKYGEKSVSIFIKDMYSNRLDIVLDHLGIGLERAEQGWVNHIEDNYI